MDELKRAVKRLGVDDAGRFTNAISHNQTDLMACILCALQHAELRLPDRTTASLVWERCDGGPYLGLYSKFRIPYKPYPDGWLDVRIHFVTSRVSASDYLEGAIEESMVVHAIRGPDGKLRLDRQ